MKGREKEKWKWKEMRSNEERVIYQDVVNGDTILSPTFMVLTSEPTSATVPVNSWPIMKSVPLGW